MDPLQKIEVSLDGQIRQKGEAVATLQLVTFNDPTALAKQGNNYFNNTSDQKPAAAKDVIVHQGRLEDSNVSPSQAAVRLVGVMRQFEMMQKAISLSGEMSRKAIEEVAKI